MYRNFRILVAEDDSGDSFLLKRGLLREGINAPVEFVPNGEEAVKYLKGEGEYGDRSKFPVPKLLLLDLKMPGMGGFEVLEWLRHNAELRRLPVLVLSGSCLAADVDRAHDLGANAYCVKPAGLEGMSQLVQGLAAFWLKCHQFPSRPESGARERGMGSTDQKTTDN